MGRPRLTAKKIQEFRKAYLELGVVTRAAQAVGIPNSTAADVAKRLEADEDFVNQRKELRARYLPEVEAILRDCVAIAHERIQNEPLTPKQQAELMNEYQLKSFSMPDPRPAYMAQIVRTAQVLNHNAEKQAESEKQSPTVVVNVAPLAKPGEEPEPESGSEDG